MKTCVWCVRASNGVVLKGVGRGVGLTSVYEMAILLEIVALSEMIALPEIMALSEMWRWLPENDNLV